MVKYKIIEMVDGKVTFTKKELEELLEEVYQEGKSDGASKIPPLWNPGVREMSSEPYCMSGTINCDGKSPTMTLKDEIAHSGPCDYNEETKRYVFYPIGTEVK